MAGSLTFWPCHPSEILHGLNARFAGRFAVLAPPGAAYGYLGDLRLGVY